MAIKIKAIEVDRNCRPTKKGDPQVGVKCEKGWIKVSGGNISDVQAGDILVLASEPAQFGKSWYARLDSIERPNGIQAPAQVAAEQVQADKLTLEDVLTVIDRVLMRLPTKWEDSPQGCRAASAIIDTIIMGVESGQIALDEPEPDLVPVPEDSERPPWERD